MYTSGLEDHNGENVYYAILNYLSELDLNNDLSIVQKGYTVQPQTKDELAAIIYKTCQEKGWDCDLNSIDTSKITDMSFLFSGDAKGGYGLEHFNGDISKWNTSNVTDMEGMFWGADSFNQNINNWDVSNVTDMSKMFCCAHSFNQPLNNWDTSNVTDMSYMFCSAHSFNQPLDKWNTKNVKNMAIMFNGAASFNQQINTWNTSNVIDIDAMFGNACPFKSELPKFNNYKGSKEELLEELGLDPDDYKLEIKKDQDQEKAHKKSMSR